MKPDLANIQSKLGRGKSTIGLHISSYSVKAAQIVNYKGQATLIKTAEERISLNEGVGADSAISSALRVVLSQFSLMNAAIICTFHDPQVFVRKITTPPMPLQELGPAVQLAVKNAFPFSLDEAVMDFRLVNKFSHQGKERYNILVAAVPIKTIERIQGLFMSGHFKVTSCIPVAIALENLIARSGLKADETLAVIIFGSTVSELAIYRDSHLEFSRKLSIAAEDITKSMTGAFYSDSGKIELTLTEAQEIEKEYGIPKTDEAVQSSIKITSNQILMLIGPKIEQFATEINRSFDYYGQELQGGKVGRVLLIGEASRLKRLDEFLSDKLGLEVTCGNLLEGIGVIDPSLFNLDDASQKQVLAIASALEGPKGINLLSRRTDKKNKQDIEPGVLKGIVVAITMVITFAFIFLNNQIQAKSTQLGFKDHEFASRLIQARETLTARRLSEGRPSWGEILKIFSYMPRDIYLSELNLSKDQLHIKGILLVDGKSSRETLAHFISSLQEGLLKDARLKLLKKVNDETDKFEFEIVAGVEAVKK